MGKTSKSAVKHSYIVTYNIILIVAIVFMIGVTVWFWNEMELELSDFLDIGYLSIWLAPFVDGIIVTIYAINIKAKREEKKRRKAEYEAWERRMYNAHRVNS